jgi:hypothetical protein
MFENRVLRGMFGPTREEVTGGWRRLHNEKVHYLYAKPKRRMRWAGHVTRIGEMSNAYRLLVEKPEWKRPRERPRRRW